MKEKVCPWHGNTIGSSSWRREFPENGDNIVAESFFSIIKSEVVYQTRFVYNNAASNLISGILKPTTIEKGDTQF
jgi:hypothetical protein